MKKAVLLNVGFDYARYDTHLQPSPPLGILSLGAYLAAHDVPVELIDVHVDFGFGLTADAEQVVCQRVARYLQEQADDVAWVGISQLSNVPRGVALAQEIRAALPDTPIVFGGYFPSSNYEFLLSRYPCITAIVRGDGEAAALQISRSLAEGRSFLSEQTPNLAWRQGGEIRTTPVRPVALDDLPDLDFRLLRNLPAYEFILALASRGCPFRCNYCLEKDMRPYAAYPAQWVSRQLDHLESELPRGHIGIFDPIFGVGRERTLEMCRVMRDRCFTYLVQSRVDVLTPELIPHLHQAGVEAIFWGLESASPATLLRMNKVRSEAEAQRYLDDAARVLRSCFENQVFPLVGFMLGFPGDSEADLEATLEFTRSMGQLCGQVAARTGVEASFAPLPVPTSIYAGSPLADGLARDFPQTVARPGPYIGESDILSSSPGVGVDVVQRYEGEIYGHERYTPRASELVDFYFPSPKAFVAAHPELTDAQGVTRLCGATF